MKQRTACADPSLQASDVIMFQADGKGIAMRPEYRKGDGQTDAAHPGLKKMTEVIAVADFTPAVRSPGTSPPRQRAARGAPRACRTRQVGRGVDHRDHRGHDRRSPTPKVTAAILRRGSGSGCSSSTGTSSRSPPSAPTPGPGASKCRCS